jgi:hypothetical protein
MQQAACGGSVDGGGDYLLSEAIWLDGVIDKHLSNTKHSHIVSPRLIVPNTYSTNNRRYGSEDRQETDSGSPRPDTG